LGGLVIVLWIRSRIKQWARRRKEPRLNPRLQQYEGGRELAQQRSREASKIVATSTGAQIVGYNIVRQVDAIFVDGFRRPEEAIEGLKATAAMKGANAVTNVQTQRTAAGKCSAQGDAVLVKKVEGDE
jgi:uncharacterized protein YbjQ (UPF0145 family)